MPKVRAGDKFAELDEAEREAVLAFRELAVKLGRAVSLSLVAALASGGTEDEAIAAADRAWTALADRIIEFALED